MITVKELIEALQEFDPEMPVILQKDSEGNGYSPLAAWGKGTYVADSTWSGEVYDEDWTAEDCAMEKKDFKKMRAKNPMAIILAPTN